MIMLNNHYYSENQDNLVSKPETFDLFFRENKFKFKTDAGVFSKNYIDFGSFTMLNTFVPNDIECPILDMGAGYGPIGIVVAKLYQKKVLMAEINSRAVELALENVKENGVSDLVTVVKSNLFENIPNIKFSSVITNPPIRAGKKVCYEIYEQACLCLCPGGELWVVIQKKQGAPSTKNHLTELFGNCEIVDKNKGYFILKSIKKD